MELKRVFDILLWVLAPLVSLCYLVTDLTNDARIYLGVEHIAANYYPFPAGIDLAWEIKPIFNRVINFVLYKVATVFVSFEDHFLFGVAVKAIVLLMVVLVAWYFARQVRIPYAFSLVFFSFTAIANFCVMQAEYFAALFSVLAIGMLLDRHLWVNFLAGCVMTCVFLTKGVTGLLIVPVICGWYLLDGEITDYLDGMLMIDELKMFIAGFLTAGYGFVVMGILYWHNMVSDILISPHLARVGSTPLVNVVVWFIAQGIVAPLYIPVLLAGFIIGGIFYFAFVQNCDGLTRGAYLLLWIVPCFIVLVQGELFLYHYLAFVPSAVVTLVFLERERAGMGV